MTGWTKVVAIAALAIAGCTDAALEAGDCPGTPTDVTLEPIAPVNAGLLAVTFHGDSSLQGVELQRYSPSRSVWEQTYGSFGQRDDGTFVVQLRPQTTITDAMSPFKVRVRSSLQGCPPSGWAESDEVTLGDPLVGTTWVTELGRTDYMTQLSASSSTVNTSTGPYRISTTSPFKHSMTFKPNNVFSELLDFTIESGHAGDVYSNCHFVLAYEGVWNADYDYDSRVGVYARTFVSSTGSTCANPPIADLDFTNTMFETNTFYVSNINYQPLLEVPVGKPRWQIYNYLQNTFASAIGFLRDDTGADTASMSGYINVFDPTYQKQ